MSIPVINHTYNDLTVVAKEQDQWICICKCGGTLSTPYGHDITYGKIQRCKSCRRKGKHNSMYGKQHSNKQKFRKYNSSPLINYDDYIETLYSKKYRQKCNVCDKDKGYRSLDCLGLPCVSCYTLSVTKYTQSHRRLREATKARINSKFRRKVVGLKTIARFKDLPFTLEQLVTHIEKLFSVGMSWDNYGGRSGWQLDHIIPDSSFKYDSPKHPDFKKCWNLENLQPMWAIDNQRKGAKYV